jgi:outer membrane receptor protein involved in Fe transport
MPALPKTALALLGATLSGTLPAAFTLSALALAAGQAAAQSGEAVPNETITVTARRVDERIIDVPLTIRALTGRDLSDRGISNVTDLAAFTPGLSYSPDLGRAFERPVIRGISALRPEAPQPVSVFIDGLFLRSGALSLPLDDAQRVEVIKGPQSALYGRSTYAGAINYITVKPGNELKGTATVTAAQAREFSAFGAVSFPLVKDTLAMRVKARTHKFGGQYFNTQTGNPVGGESTDSIGAIVAFTPGSAFDATLSLDQTDVRDGLFNAVARTVPTQVAGVVTSQNGSSNLPNGAVCNGRTINIVGNNAQGLPDANVPATAANRLNGWPCGPATHSTGPLVRRNELEFNNYVDPATGINYGNIAGLERSISRTGLTMNLEFGGGYTLTSQTGFTRDKGNVGSDESYNGTQFAITGASWLSYNRDVTEYWSQELRLSSPDKGPFTWLVGAFIYDEETSGFSSGVIQRVGAVVSAAPLRPKSGSAITNAAPFGRVQFALGDFRVSAEGRYNRETVEVVGTNLGTATVSAGTCVAGQPCFVSGKRTFTDFSPRLTADWKPGKDSLVYGQLARGSKAGGFNTSAGITADRFTFEGETVKSAELGYKGVFGGGRFGFSTAVFRNDIDGLQLSNIITIVNPFSPNPAAPTSTTVTVVNNVGKARTEGVEFDLSWRATDWLTLIANYAYTDAKALEGTEVTNGTVFGGNQSVAGFTLPRTPKHSAAGSIALDVPTGMGAVRWTARADVIYQSRRYAEIQNMIWADPYTRVNLATGLRGNGWRVSLWVKNATDDDTSLNGFRYLDPVTFRRSAVDFLPRLRQVGLTGTVEF